MIVKILCIVFFVIGFLFDHIMTSEEIDPNGDLESAFIVGSFLCYLWSLIMLMFMMHQMVVILILKEEE